ncbi:hypothetical protein [Microcystis aeruginosa]|nr:hypothetical protein [Microcystis aeruginosa]
MNYKLSSGEVGKWGSGEVGKWGSGEVGEFFSVNSELITDH